MSDKKNQKPKVGFFDSGIDEKVKDFVGIKFHKIAKTPNDILQSTPCTHGTAVFGIFYRTLNNLMGKNGSRIKSIENSSLDIVDSSMYQKVSKDTAVANVLAASDILNISLACRLPDSTVAKTNNMSSQFKQSRQKGTLTFTAAGNQEGFWGGFGYIYFSANDTFPSNDLYVLTVGGIYPKNFEKPQGVSITQNPSAGRSVSSPGTAVIFSTPGRHATYNTQSFPYAVGKKGYPASREEAKQNQVKIPDYVDISGTSFSSPTAAAFATFVKLERPDLNSNNIEHLLIAATEKIKTDELTNAWQIRKVNSKFLRTVNYNHAKSYWNGEEQPIYYEWGLGTINQDRLVHLVKTWEIQDIVEEEITIVNSRMTYDGEYYSYTFNCKTVNKAYVLSLNVENKDIARQKVNYLSITSPSGTESHIHHPQFSWSKWMKIFDTVSDQAKGVFYSTPINYLESSIDNRLKNTHFYGENTKGNWVVKSNVPLEKVEIVFRSIKKSPDDIYRYDDRILKVDKPAALEDKNSGTNVIDLSYYKVGKTEVELSDNKREIRFMTANSRTPAKIVPIGEGNFQRVIHGALGGITIR